jgi:multidrug resistance efflux pump
MAEYSPTPDMSVSDDLGMSADDREAPMEAVTEPTARGGGKKAVGAIALAALLAVAGGGAWFAFDKSTQEQKLAEAQAISAKTFDPNQLGKVEALQDAHAQLKKAVALLAEIPNRPGSPYEQAQAELKALQPKLQEIETKLNAEKPAIDKLESAKKLAMDASIIVQNPPHKADVWQNAQTKWQESLKLLESISPNSLAAAEVKQKLELYRSNYAAITAQLQKQKQIDFAASLWPQALGPDLQASIQQLKARNLQYPQFISGCIEIVSPRLNVGELKQRGFQPDQFSKVFCEYVASIK